MNKATSLSFALLLAVPLAASGQTVFQQGTTTLGTVSSSIAACASSNPEVCLPRDLVLRTKAGKTILVRKITNCQAAASTLLESPDTESAECFR